MLTRDWRAGELTVLIAALVLAVAQHRHGRILRGSRQGRADEAGEPAARRRRDDLGRSAVARHVRRAKRRRADSSRRPVIAVQQHGAARGRETSDDGAVLADVKAVAPGYPLRGAIMLADPAVADGSRGERHSAARRGVARRAPRAAPRHQGRRHARRRRRDAQGRCDRAAGARGRERLARHRAASADPYRRRPGDQPAAAGQPRDLSPARRRSGGAQCARSATCKWLQAAACGPASAWRTSAIVRPEVRQTLERAEQFLGLAALVAVILAAVAVALAASRYLRRHLDTARCCAASAHRGGGRSRCSCCSSSVLGHPRERVGVAARARAARALLVALLGVASRRRSCRRRRIPAGVTAFAHRRAAAVRLRAAAADRARERAAAARAASRPAAADARAGSGRLRCWARASSRC